VDDDPLVIQTLTHTLTPHYQTLSAACVKDAEIIIQSQPIHVLLCDHHMEGEEGLSFLGRIKESHPSIQRILITGDVNTELLLEAINKGLLFRFLAKPFTPREALQMVDDAFLHHTALQKQERLAQIRLNIANAAKLAGLAIAGILVMLIAFLILGTLIFLLLYFFKSALGIDLLPNRHLSDLI
jgi:DNA-binding NtrC family response regulator